MNRAVTGIATAILATAALVAGPGPASAQPTVSMDLTLGRSGFVRQGGLLIDVPVQVTCTFSGSFEDAELFVDLHQTRRGLTAEGTGGLSVTESECDGAIHTITVPLYAWDGSFRPGPALADVVGRICAADATGGVCGGPMWQRGNELRLRH